MKALVDADVKALVDASRHELALGKDYALAMVAKGLDAAYKTGIYDFTGSGVCTNTRCFFFQTVPLRSPYL